MELLEIVGAINGLIFMGIFTFYFSQGSITGRGYKSAAYLLLAVCGGAAIAQVLPQASQIELQANLECHDMGFWHECGGWLFYFSTNASFVEAIGDHIGESFSIPASVAIFLGAWWINARLLSGLIFTPKDIMRAFAAGFFVYASVLYLPDLQRYLSEVFVELTVQFSSPQDGRRVLQSWGEAITALDTYAEEVSSGIFGWQGYLLKTLLFFPFLLSDFLNLVVFCFQVAALGLIPVSLFLASLRRDSDPTYLFTLLGNLAILSFLQSVEWMALGLLPELEVPKDLSDLKVGEVLGHAIPSGLIYSGVTFVVLGLAVYFVVFPSLKLIFNLRLQ